MSNILFSVIVASYNNGRYLRELFDSMLAQSYQNWELIFADDCSTDDSLAIVKQFSEEDSRVKFFEHSKNLGVGAAFRTAADHARGEVIGMLGADDALTSDAIEKMVAAHLNAPEASLINSDAYRCDENLNILGKCESFSELPLGVSLIENICVSNFASFKKAAYDKTLKFNSSFKRAVDHDIFLKLDELGSLSYVHEKLYLYRENPNGVSQNNNGLRASQSSLLAKRDAYFRRLGTTKKNLSYLQFKTMMITYYLRESYFYRINNRSMCNHFLMKALVEFPSIITKRDYWSILIRNNISLG